MNTNLKKQINRTIIFGGLNTLFAYLILIFFLYLNFHYSVATLISAIISVGTGYFLNKYFVFSSNKSRSIIQYYFFWFLMYNFSVFIQFFLLEILNSLNLYLNSFIATFLTVIISFIVNKFYFFKK